MTDRSIRVSDAERESVAELLRDAYVAGRLDRGEFDERSAAACSAKTRGQLSDLTADLPMPVQAGDLPAGDLTVLGARRKGKPAISGHRRGVLFVLLLAVAGLLIAAPSFPAAVVLACVLAVCMLGGGLSRRG